MPEYIRIYCSTRNEFELNWIWVIQYLICDIKKHFKYYDHQQGQEGIAAFYAALN